MGMFIKPDKEVLVDEALGRKEEVVNEMVDEKNTRVELRSTSGMSAPGFDRQKNST